MLCRASMFLMAHFTPFYKTIVPFNCFMLISVRALTAGNGLAKWEVIGGFSHQKNLQLELNCWAIWWKRGYFYLNGIWALIIQRGLRKILVSAKRRPTNKCGTSYWIKGVIMSKTLTFKTCLSNRIFDSSRCEGADVNAKNLLNYLFAYKGSKPRDQKTWKNGKTPIAKKTCWANFFCQMIAAFHFGLHVLSWNSNYFFLADHLLNLVGFWMSKKLWNVVYSQILLNIWNFERNTKIDVFVFLIVFT